MRWPAVVALGAMLAGLQANPAEARKMRKRRPADARTAGLGHSCRSKAECGHPAQVCLKQNDANGKQIARGFCALPCRAIDQGLKNPEPGKTNADGGVMLDKPPPRCPKKYECRGAGSGVPIDMCVRQ